MNLKADCNTLLTWAPAYQTEALYLAVANFFLLWSVSVANKAHGVGYSAGIRWSMAADDLDIGSVYGLPVSLYKRASLFSKFMRPYLCIRVHLFQASLETSFLSHPISDLPHVLLCVIFLPTCLLL